MKKIIIKRIPMVKGCYGERLLVDTKYEDVNNFVKLISLWANNSCQEEDNHCSILYELPVGVSVKTDSCLQLAFTRLGVDFQD